MLIYFKIINLFIYGFLVYIKINSNGRKSLKVLEKAYIYKTASEINKNNYRDIIL